MYSLVDGCSLTPGSMVRSLRVPDEAIPHVLRLLRVLHPDESEYLRYNPFVEISSAA